MTTRFQAVDAALEEKITGLGEIALHNATLHNAVNMARAGMLTFEQAMAWAASTLAAREGALMERLMNYVNRTVPPIFIVQPPRDS